MYKHILIATDGSELATNAVIQGTRLALACKAKVTILTVTEPFHSLGDRDHMFAGLPDQVRQQAKDFLFESARKTLEQARKTAAAAEIECQLKSVEDTRPYAAIIATAEEDGCDLIVMASHGRSGISRVLLGSETTKVLAHTNIPTLVCR